MIGKEMKVIFDEFNYRVNNLIKSFSNNNLDEESLIFLSKRTKHLLSFTHKILLKALLKFLKGLNQVKYKINEDIFDIDKMLFVLIERINSSIDDMLNEKVDEKRKEDIYVIVEYLIIFKNIINVLGNLILSVLKFQVDEINENEFKKEYRTFKYDIQDEKSNLEKRLHITL